MVKKGVVAKSKKKVKKAKSVKKRKRTSKKKKAVVKHVIKTVIVPTENKLDKALAQNMIALQSVMVSLTEKLGGLTDKVSNLVELFESSAKAIAEKDFKQNKKMEGQLDNLAEQNKILARGLTLLHENEPTDNLNDNPPVAPGAPNVQDFKTSDISRGDVYNKSISSGLKPLPKLGSPMPGQNSLPKMGGP